MTAPVSNSVPEWRLVPVTMTDEMLRASLAVEWPATYKTALRHEFDGERMTADTTRRIGLAIMRHAAMIAAAPAAPAAPQAAPELADLTDEQARTVQCMDSWAQDYSLPTYTELRTLAEQYDAMLRNICFQYAAGGYNSEGLIAPDAAEGKLRWIIEEASRPAAPVAQAVPVASELPPLPDGHQAWFGTGYTAEQMRAYARAALTPPAPGDAKK